jgi:hypothetical protein
MMQYMMGSPTIACVIDVSDARHPIKPALRFSSVDRWWSCTLIGLPDVRWCFKPIEDTVKPPQLPIKDRRAMQQTAVDIALQECMMQRWGDAGYKNRAFI